MLDDGLFSKKLSSPGGRFIAGCEFQPAFFGVQINRSHFQILRAVGVQAGFLRSRVALCRLGDGRLEHPPDVLTGLEIMNQSLPQWNSSQSDNVCSPTNRSKRAAQ